VASDQTLRAIITVLDRTSEPIRQINARFAAMSAPLRQIGSRIGALAEETGIKGIGQDAMAAAQSIGHLGAGLLRLAGPLAGLGAAGAIAGLAEMVKSSADFEEQLSLTSARTGIAADQLAGLQYAAVLTNVDTERLDRGLTMLNRTLADAASGKNKDAAAMLASMGVGNAPGHLASTATALAAVSDKVKQLVDSGQIQVATQLVDKLFGARAGAALLPVFEKGSAALGRISDQAKALGIAPSAEDVAAGTKFAEAYKGMSGAVEGLKLSIGNDLLPQLTPLIEGMKDWLVAARPWLSTDISEKVQELGATIKGFDWKRIGVDIKEIGSAIKWVAGEIGAHPILGLGALAAFSLAPQIAAFGQLGIAVGVFVAKMLLFPAATALTSLVSMVPAIGGVRDAMAALSLVMDANPLGVIILAGAAVVAVAVEIYEHWATIAPFMKDLWGNVAATFEAAGKTIHASLVNLANDFEWVWAKIKPIVDMIGGAISMIENSSIGKFLGAGASAANAAGAVGAPAGGISLPSLSQGTPGAQGQTHVVVDFKNAPPGTAVATTSRGNATPPDVNVGYAFPMGN
jgi:hypothetical protein